MFTHLGVRNFKALDDFQIDLAPLTVLIGENSCGKSTVLQALDLLGNIATRDIGEYFEDRQWTYGEVRSQQASEEGISFDLNVRCTDGSTLDWSISMELVDADGAEEWHVRESITDKSTGELLLGYGVPDVWGSRIYDPNLMLAYHNGRRSEPTLVKLSSSALKVIDAYAGEKWMDLDPRLFELRRELASTCAVDLLSPDAMRSRGIIAKAKDIGRGGSRLASYIHGLAEPQRRALDRLLFGLFGHPVGVETREGPGFVDLYLWEEWPDAPDETVVDRRLMSDGILRIVALVALYVGEVPLRAARNGDDLYPMSTTDVLRGPVLIDEVENGLNPSVVGLIMEMLGALAADGGRQVVVTTHSPLTINSVDSDGIMFLWREDSGRVRAERLFSSPEFAKMLDLLNPGEIWINYSKDHLVRALAGASEGN